MGDWVNHLEIQQCLIERQGVGNLFIHLFVFSKSAIQNQPTNVLMQGRTVLPAL